MRSDVARSAGKGEKEVFARQFAAIQDDARILDEKFIAGKMMFDALRRMSESINPWNQLTFEMKTLVASFSFLIGSAFFGFGSLSVIDSAVNPANGHTYDLLSTSDWIAAENAAMSLGGHLATINNQAENDWVWNKWGHTRSLMIGLTDAASEGHFVWTSGEAFTYSNWTAGEPNNGVGYGQEPENYVRVYADGFGTPGAWNDFSGTGPISPQPDLFGVVEIVPEPTICGIVLLGAIARRILGAGR